MFLHLRRSRILAGLSAILLSIGVISIYLSRTSQLADYTLPTSERIDRICTTKRTKCFQVVDRKIDWNDEEVVSRNLEMVLPSGSTFTESVVRIVPVKRNATFADSDTRLWRVDGDDMGKDYLMAMSMIPFMTRVFRLGRKREEKKIALIGGGGTAILSHLRTLRDGFDATVVEKEKDVAELSKRWFDLGDATVVNENGVEWMRPKEGNVSRYDVIFIDACERQSAQHCPDPLFTKDENVKNLRQMLNDDTRALVVINFEIYNALKWEMLHQQMSVLLSSFPHCVSVDLKKGVNMIVGCLTRPLPFHDKENPRASLDASMYFVVQQFAEAIQELQYGHIFNEFGVHAMIDGKRETIQHPADKEVD
ncbi:hypothetical protein PRIPAC_73100 [Pristionchus pacificus]|uniref:Uncharacterized protein n=1 Tax=Pristionchus pacificus TaxID=54126 RepID=A0A2A6CZJ7_PRIPA|nr:hypothetical protein PRIPAC_73100 [Pristionchus pacificus]|eukprot:PDM83530.1 hypothetical protein PRIPAC_30017 [Pristionchus pacificus]